MSDKVVLYKLDISPCCRAVSIVAQLIGLELDERVLDLLKGEHLKPEFLKINPEHTVPTIVDNGKSLWESHAIVTYLVDKYAKNDDLYPKDVYLRARCNQRLYFDAGVLFQRMAQASRSIYNGGYEVPKILLDGIVASYDLLESTIGDDNYLIGNKLTVADICAMTSVTSSDEIYVPIDSTKYPKITAWLNRIKALDWYEEKNGKFINIYKQYLGHKMEENKKNASN